MAGFLYLKEREWFDVVFLFAVKDTHGTWGEGGAFFFSFNFVPALALPWKRGGGRITTNWSNLIVIYFPDYSLKFHVGCQERKKRIYILYNSCLKG